MGRKRTDVAARIYRAAKGLFAHEGYEGADVNLIAKRAHTSPSQIYRLFHNKRGLLNMIFDVEWKRINEQCRQALDGKTDALDRLLKVFFAVIEYFDEDKEAQSIFLNEGRRFIYDADFGRKAVGLIHHIRLLDVILEEGQKTGELKPDFTVEAVRSGLMGALEGMLRDQLYRENFGYPAEFSTENIKETLQVFMKSLSAEKELTEVTKGV